MGRHDANFVVIGDNIDSQSSVFPMKTKVDIVKLVSQAVPVFRGPGVQNFDFLIVHPTMYRVARLETRNVLNLLIILMSIHDDVIKWKHFPCYWPFVRGIHRFQVNSPHKGQWRGALMFSLICVWINGWVNNCEAGDLRPYRAHYDVTLMLLMAWADTVEHNDKQIRIWMLSTYIQHHFLG